MSICRSFARINLVWPIVKCVVPLSGFRESVALIEKAGKLGFVVASLKRDKKKPGDDLLSRPEAVPSALGVLTSVFGMGTGVAPPQ